MRAVMYIENINYEFAERDDFDELVDDEDNSVLYEEKVERFQNVLNEAFTETCSKLSKQEEMIFLLLLKGVKKVDISSMLGISIQSVNTIEKKICNLIAQRLSEKLHMNCDEKMIAMYLRSVKEYMHEVTRKWEMWYGYREKVADEKEEKIKQALRKEIDKHERRN